MTLSDARGLSLDTRSTRARDGWEAALRRLNTYRGDPVAEIDGVLTEHPDFAAGLILRGHALVGAWEASIRDELRATVERLRVLAPRLDDRETGHAAALADWLAGDWNGYRARLAAVAIDHPRDLLALQAGHLADFCHGDREELRGRPARALGHWDEATPGYAFVVGMAAFGLEECGAYDRAEAAGRAAVELDPEDCWAHHAVAHVHEMQGRLDDGIAWMAARRPYWAQDDNGFAFHNWWHLALYHLDRGETDRVLDLYDAALRPGDGALQLEMLDAAALLWRLHLLDVDVGPRWAPLADAYEVAAQDGAYAFYDMHAAMAYAATGRITRLDRLIAAAQDATAGAGSNAAMTRIVGLPVLIALRAVAAGRWEAAIEPLLTLGTETCRFGGSHAQRDVIRRTLTEAAIRGGRPRLADALLAEREWVKPGCRFAARQRARLAPEPVRA